jgi:hypothetical protein
MKPFVNDKGRSLSQAPLEENTAGKIRPEIRRFLKVRKAREILPDSEHLLVAVQGTG